MEIQGFTTLTMLDYPGKIAATIFTPGCNLCCHFCHNKGLVLSEHERIDSEEILSFLKKRKGILEGVAISGGEPLIHAELPKLIKSIRDIGYPIKLDTNGSMPDKLESLIRSGLVDYVAMDIKNTPQKYPLTVGIPGIDISPFIKSADILMKSGIEYEFRTTLVRQFHTKEDLIEIGKWLYGAKRYCLQNFVDNGKLLGNLPLSGFSEKELDNFSELIRPYFMNVTKR